MSRDQTNDSRPLVPPMVDSSTFVFPTARDAKFAFAHAYGLSSVIESMHTTHTNQKPMPIYARLGGPTIDACEAAMKKHESNADWSLVFPSGMAAISTLVLAVCHQQMHGNPGMLRKDVVIHNKLLYGGTHALMHEVLDRFGFMNVVLDPNVPRTLEYALKEYGNRVALVFIETPTNPTLELTDISAIAYQLARMYTTENKPIFAVDNTFAGIFQNPLDLGADVSVYSATKYIGGHEDLLAGFLLGKNRTSVLHRGLDGNVSPTPIYNVLKFLRTIMGFVTAPEVAHKLYKHMLTYRLRMQTESNNATVIAKWLVTHVKVKDVLFPGLLLDDARAIYHKQMSAPSGMISLRLSEDTEDAAYRFIDALQIFERSVSLGSCTSLVNHPRTWTHADIPRDELDADGVTPGFVRLSIGLEDTNILIADLAQALEQV